MENSKVDQSGRNLRIGAWVLSVVGLFLLVYASFLYLNIRHKKMKWTPVTGTVVNFIVDPAIGGAAPIIVFDWKGDSLSYTSDQYSSPPQYELQEQVSMFIDPASPTEAILDSFHLYQLFLILGSLGFLFNLVGFGILFFSKA